MSVVENSQEINAMRAQIAATKPFAGRWQDLHTMGQQIAAMAQLAEEPMTGPLADFPQRLSDIAPWQRDLAEQALEDLDAILQPGLTALRAIEKRGHDTTAPALALWREYRNAREALLAMAPHQQA